MSFEDISEKVNEVASRESQGKKIKRISLFGSQLTGLADDDSDIDLLVEFTSDAVIGFFELSELQTIMENYLNKPVDLLTPDAISDYFKHEILNNAKVIYEK